MKFGKVSEPFFVDVQVSDDSGLDVAVMTGADFGCVNHQAKETMVLKSQEKLISEIEYYGLSLLVPDWASTIATDKNGQVFAFSTGMYGVQTEGDVWTTDDGHQAQMIATVDLNGIDWKNTRKDI